MVFKIQQSNETNGNTLQINRQLKSQDCDFETENENILASRNYSNAIPTAILTYCPIEPEVERSRCMSASKPHYAYISISFQTR